MAEKIVKDSQCLAKDLVNDCISRQEAIDIVNKYKKSHMILWGKPMVGAASIVIELEELPPVQPELPDICVGDIISRQAAIDALDVLCQEHRYRIPGKVETYSQYNEAWQDALGRAEGVIGNLPSAQPERKRGKWKPYRCDMYECSECGYIYTELTDRHRCGANYCPNCGADMREVSE